MFVSLHVASQKPMNLCQKDRPAVHVVTSSPAVSEKSINFSKKDRPPASEKRIRFLQNDRPARDRIISPHLDSETPIPFSQKSILWRGISSKSHRKYRIIQPIQQGTPENQYGHTRGIMIRLSPRASMITRTSVIEACRPRSSMLPWSNL
jgi:hypothetical protein